MLLFREKHFLKRVKSWDRITKMKYLHKRHEDTQIISPKTLSPFFSLQQPDRLVKMTMTVCVLQYKKAQQKQERERDFSININNNAMQHTHLYHIYLDHATASISACALRYNSSLFERALRLSMIAGSSFSNEDRRLGCKDDLCRLSVFNLSGKYIN